MSEPPKNAPADDAQATLEQPDAATLATEHPADVADAIELLEPDAGAELLRALPPDAAAHALEEMYPEDAYDYVSELSAADAADALQRMAPDDAVDVLAELEDDHRDAILAKLPDPFASELAALLTYPPDCAGGIMSPQYVALHANLSAAEAIDELRSIADRAEQIYYAYVVDHQHRLLGVLSLRDLILAKPSAPLHELMITKLVSVPDDMDREEVAQLIQKYGYYAVPVVGKGGELLGIVTHDDVLDIMELEATEDMQVMVGAGAHERIDTPLGDVLRARLPWLMVNLVTAFLAALVIGLFEATLAQAAFLAVLMPIVAGQAGNTGAQSMAVVIRGIATGELQDREVSRMLGRNVLIGAVSGVAGGGGGVPGLLGVADSAVRPGGPPTEAVVLGIAMVLCMMIAAVSGAAVPWAMKRLGFDPAQSSSIILTTITDIAGFGIFLALGVLLLTNRLGQ